MTGLHTWSPAIPTDAPSAGMSSSAEEAATFTREEGLMPRHYPQEEIDRIKTEISLQRLVEASGIKLKRHGAKDLVGRCPFHNDRTPSLIITPGTNEWHCMGACGEGGDVIRGVMKARGISFPHAMELLKADHPALSANLDRVVRVGTAVKLEAPFERIAGPSYRAW